jgi:4-hydroxy-3-polyprenylbenzoate decarboxylase
MNGGAMSEHPITQAQPRIVVGITGASGVVYGIRMLSVLRGLGVETHLVMSNAARITLSVETDLKPSDVEKLADVVHSNKDVGAACSSGSFKTMGMIVAPCSAKTLAEIATGVTSSLIARAADVTLKERRRLVLMFRETPIHLGHIRAMAQASEAGAIICPPVPAFYARPATIDDLVDHTVGRVLDLFDIDASLAFRWQGARAQLDAANVGSNDLEPSASS